MILRRLCKLCEENCRRDWIAEIGMMHGQLYTDLLQISQRQKEEADDAFRRAKKGSESQAMQERKGSKA
ncbi:hypothetical protein BOX15_Mlig009097g1 [Macrostomum lignano]|uniref:Uncharacterized protein n=1 Tax=Macrostomum lignano TaxID=282301 RepID=A0A267F429_9PLAT|nr:hypothetical protein BOX15_Mlig009097g1 [Macrostomum lignano]